MVECYKPEESTNAFAAYGPTMARICRLERFKVSIVETWTIVSHYKSFYRVLNSDLFDGPLSGIANQFHIDLGVTIVAKFTTGVNRIDDRFIERQQSLLNRKAGVSDSSNELCLHFRSALDYRQR